MSHPASPSASALVWRVFAVAAVVLAVLAPSQIRGDGVTEAAGRAWCRVDPVFLIDGQVAHVRVAASVENRRAARSLSAGPIAVVLTLPVGVPARFLADDNGFGDDYDVRIERSDALVPKAGVVPVRIEALAPLDDPSVRVFVEFAPAGPVNPGPSRTDETAGDETWSGGNTTAGPGAHTRRPKPRPSLLPGSASGFANEWISISTGT